MLVVVNIVFVLWKINFVIRSDICFIKNIDENVCCFIEEIKGR